MSGSRVYRSQSVRNMLTLIVMLSGLLYASADGSADAWKYESRNDPLSEGSTCKLKAGGTGTCTRIDKCEPFVKREIAYSNLSRCSFIHVTEVICCPTSNNPGNSTPPTAVKAIETKGGKIRPSKAACEKYKSGNPARLGYSIIDGEEAAPGDFPHIGVMLYKSEKAGAQYEVKCGCSLISENYAVTAAHCLQELPLLVRLGTVEWNPTDNFTYVYDAKIKKITIHEEYQSSSYYNDIALIEFTEPVTISNFIAPVCLRSEMADVDSSVQMKVAGWGIINVDTRATSDVLMSTNITTVPLGDCNATHVGYGVSRRYSRGLIDSQYCAFDPGFKKSSCRGDSGGPLSIDVDNWPEIVGIVSFGTTCGSRIPSVFTRIAFFLDWIEKKVWPTPTNS